MTWSRSVPARAWDVLERYGVATALRQTYLVLRMWPHGWRYRINVGNSAAEMAVSNWFEYKRVRQLHGERAVLGQLLSDLDGDTVFWDVGANVGVYSCLAASVLPQGAVVGFEPEPNNQARLRENLARNDPECKWHVAPVALWDADAECQLALDFSSEFDQVGAGHYYLSDAEGQEIDCRRAETMIQQGYPHPEVVKIDVQGAELPVLRGFGAALEAVETVYLELHTNKAKRYDTTVEETEQYLREAGFSVTPLGKPSGFRTGVYHVRASR
ncbi:FkbM family methyltransferase [Halorarius litoreus]|uniref:FkbM family methyltransferase n=1 Tax=Halorarius litoreus TaxID=2962676 RepID=UPI0020CCF42B|nr:FkbM family methyltransferase [Halorarius litoreus]